jgi:hypothetical protein
MQTHTVEHVRLRANRPWKDWGPYLNERAWGNVREDSAADSQPWEHVPFDQARSRAFRWSEDGLAGFCDSEQRLCMALGLWNERDSILKERLFGLGNTEGNHGEDIKELYVFLDGLPSHAYAKARYIYPQVAFPYDDLRTQNAERSRDVPEYELTDALRDVLAEGRYFDVVVEYAKADPHDVLCRITATNRGPDAAPLHLLPHLWFRNTWAGSDSPVPQLVFRDGAVRVDAEDMPKLWWFAQAEGHTLHWLFTDNETNHEALTGKPNTARYTKDGIGDSVVQGRLERVNPALKGTRCAAHVSATVEPGESLVILTRLADVAHAAPFADADALFSQRQREADEFYAATQRGGMSEDERHIQRQAFAGLTWSKTFYHFNVKEWHDESGGEPEEWVNKAWGHMRAKDIISVPDKWEYPWFAAWDQVFQAVTIGLVDIEFAKQQVNLLLNDRYQHPDGQLPGFEGNLDMANPPIHAWGALHLYELEKQLTGERDTDFLKHIFHKLLLNYGWWFMPRDSQSELEGGFLGMDNISLFNRSEPPEGYTLIQADSYGWMGLFTLNMLEIAVELAQDDVLYEDHALHFMNGLIWLIDRLHATTGKTVLLWDDDDGFFYDVLLKEGKDPQRLKIRSYVGLIPFTVVGVFKAEHLAKLEKLRGRLDGFARNHGEHLRGYTADDGATDAVFSLALLQPERMERLLKRLVAADEFMSDYGLRSVSRYHAQHPFTLNVDGERYVLEYEPGDSRTDLAGGNSNWRGPVWAPVNLLVIEALRKYDTHYSALVVPSPDGSDSSVSPGGLADLLCQRLIGLFRRGTDGKRPVFGNTAFYHDDPHWGDCVLFFEHFHGDRGYGLGASHQNGWTALIAKLIQDCGAVAVGG